MAVSPEAVLQDSFGRREFLRRGGGGLMLGLGAMLPGCGSGGRGGKGVFSDSARTTLYALCERLLPNGEEGPSRGAIGVAEKIEELVSQLGGRSVADFRHLLSLFEWSPILFEAKPGRFSTLPPESQTEVIQGWATSRLGFRRTGFVAIKRVAMSVYYAQETSWPAIGFPGPWLQE